MERKFDDVGHPNTLPLIQELTRHLTLKLLKLWVHVEAKIYSISRIYKNCTIRVMKVSNLFVQDKMPRVDRLVWLTAIAIAARSFEVRFDSVQVTHATFSLRIVSQKRTKSKLPKPKHRRRITEINYEICFLQILRIMNAAVRPEKKSTWPEMQNIFRIEEFLERD